MTHFRVKELMLLKAICVISFAAGLPSAAQSVARVSPTSMRFIDTTRGVSFRYPSSWMLTRDEPFMFAPAIQTPIASSRSSLRGLVFTKSISGVPSWPATTFSGAEFAYDARRTVSAEACRALAHTGNHPSEIDQLTVQNMRYWHATSGDGGMSQSTSDDIYTTFTGTSSNGTCLLFDLAIHSTYAPGETAPRALSRRESHLIRQSLQNVLASLQISAPSR